MRASNFFRGTCPHCDAWGVSFDLIEACKTRGKQYAFVLCGMCKVPAMAVFTEPPRRDSIAGGPPLLKLEYRLDTIYPSAGNLPEYLPKRVAQRYSEALSNMGRAAYESAGMMFRKTLELSLKTIRPDDDGNLYFRIDKAAEAGAITRDLAEWAHRVRLDGNDAAHEDTVPTAEDIRELKHFTELVLRYLFTLPGMLKRWSEKKEAARGTTDA